MDGWNFKFTLRNVPKGSVTSFARQFGSRGPGGVFSPYDWPAGASAELRFGGVVLSADDVALEEDGWLHIAIRPEHVAALEAGRTYDLAVPLIIDGAAHSFGFGTISFREGV